MDERQNEFTLISEDSSQPFTIKTDLPIKECVERIQNITSSHTGVPGWDSIYSDVQQINENEYHFYISFKTKRHRQWTATTEAEANGILRSINDHKSLIQAEYNKIDNRSGKIILILLLSVVAVTFVRYLDGTSILDLTGFIIGIIALSVIFLFWLDKASYSYRMQRLLVNLFKEDVKRR